jgi:hypothetical protein
MAHFMAVTQEARTIGVLASVRPLGRRISLTPRLVAFLAPLGTAKGDYR